MTNFFKNNYGIFINIFGLITVFLIIYIALNINLNNKDNNNDDIDDYLVSLGLKEDNIQKIYTPWWCSYDAYNVFKNAFAILSVTFIAKFAKYIFDIATGLVEAMYGSLLTAVFGTEQIALGLPDFLIFALYCIRWFVDHIICGIQGLFSHLHVSFSILSIL